MESSLLSIKCMSKYIINYYTVSTVVGRELGFAAPAPHRAPKFVNLSNKNNHFFFHCPLNKI